MMDLIIIGGGPSGITCAIAAAKAGLDYLILEKGVLANSIYHFPANMTFFSTSRLLEIGDIPFISHSDKPTRGEALEYYRRLAQHYQLRIQFYTEVTQMNRHPEGGYLVHTSRGTYPARHVVVASGYYDVPRYLRVPGEDLPKVSHYYKDPHPYIGQRLLVIGAANSACDAALETWTKGASVTMAIRGPEIYPKVKYWIKPNIENRIKEGSIQAYFNTRVLAIHEHTVVLENENGAFEIPNDFVLAMTGYEPNYELLQRLGIPCQTDANKKPAHDPETLETQLPGVYLAGVVCAGLQTSKLFIENTRHHGELIVRQILAGK